MYRLAQEIRERVSEKTEKRQTFDRKNSNSNGLKSELPPPPPPPATPPPRHSSLRCKLQTPSSVSLFLKFVVVGFHWVLGFPPIFHGINGQWYYQIRLLENKCDFNSFKLKSRAVPSYYVVNDTLHVINARCGPRDLHPTTPWLT